MGKSVNQNVENTNKLSDPNLEVTISNKVDSIDSQRSCSCKGKSIKITETDQLGSMINQIVSARKSGKATIKIEIEFSD